MKPCACSVSGIQQEQLLMQMLGILLLVGCRVARFLVSTSLMCFFSLSNVAKCNARYKMSNIIYIYIYDYVCSMCNMHNKMSSIQHLAYYLIWFFIYASQWIYCFVKSCYGLPPRQVLNRIWESSQSDTPKK